MIICMICKPLPERQNICLKYLFGYFFVSILQLPFVGYQAQQVVLLLSDEQYPVSPSQAVLLYQRCRVLLACLQHSTFLNKYIRTAFKEEFRFITLILSFTLEDFKENIFGLKGWIYRPAFLHS